MFKENSDLAIILLDKFSMLSLAAIVETVQLSSKSADLEPASFTLVDGLGFGRWRNCGDRQLSSLFGKIALLDFIGDDKFRICG